MSASRITRIIPSCRHASSSATTQSAAAATMTASARAVNSASAPTHHLITLKRSPRGLPPASRLTLESLGLHRLHQSVLYPFSGPVAGKILKVKELVEVQNVEEGVGRTMMARRRPEGAGVRVSGRVYGGGKGEVEEVGL